MAPQEKEASGDFSEADGLELQKKQNETGLIVASGLLGGESIIGVLVALSAVIGGL